MTILRSRLICLISACCLQLLGCAEDVHYDPEELKHAQAFLVAPPRPLSLSPDRTRILLEVRTVSGGRLQVVERETGMNVADYDFGGLQPIAAPTWSPDGSQIALLAVVDGAYELRIWDLTNGTSSSPIAPLSRYPLAPQWASSGARILHFVHPVSGTRTWQEGGRELYWVDPTGVEEAEMILAGLGQSYHKALVGEGQIAIFAPFGRKELAFQSEDGTVRLFPLNPTWEIGQMAWSGHESLLISVRRPGDEFYGIEEMNPATGSIVRIASGDWDLSAATYLWNRAALQHVMNVDGLRRTRICMIPAGDDCWWIGPEGMRSSVLSTYADGDSAFVLFAAPSEPPTLHLVNLRSNASRPIFEPEHPRLMTELNGVPLEVDSNLGWRIPAYYWKADRTQGHEPAVLVHVPGGPGLQAVPLWEPYISYLTSRGLDVVYMNYVGQTGYGATYENAEGGLRVRAQELLEVREHLIRNLGIRAERIILYGHSYGAPVVMYAAAQEKLMTPLLLSSVESPGIWIEPYERCVLAFHGEADLNLSPQEARRNITRIFGTRSLVEPCGHFKTFPREPHTFESASSYAEVFSSALKMLQGESERR